MKRRDLEHIVRAAAAVSDQTEIVVVGSQSLLGAVPDAPGELLVSMDADLYPLHRPDLATAIEGAIGEGSPFADTFGYFAHGVGPETARLPHGWEGRLVRVQNANTDQKIAYCLEPHDMALSKLVAGREKDGPFVAVMLRHGIVDRATLQQRLLSLEVDPATRERIRRWLAAQP